MTKRNKNYQDYVGETNISIKNSDEILLIPNSKNNNRLVVVNHKLGNWYYFINTHDLPIADNFFVIGDIQTKSILIGGLSNNVFSFQNKEVPEVSSLGCLEYPNVNVFMNDSFLSKQTSKLRKGEKTFTFLLVIAAKQDHQHFNIDNIAYKSV